MNNHDGLRVSRAGFLPLLVVCLALLVPPQEASGDPSIWWDNAWIHRAVITVDNTAGGGALTNYVVLVTVDTASPIANGEMDEQGDDIRFIDSDNATELDFWIESGVNTSDTRIWVENPSIPASSTKTIYMYLWERGRGRRGQRAGYLLVLRRLQR